MEGSALPAALWSGTLALAAFQHKLSYMCRVSFIWKALVFFFFSSCIKVSQVKAAAKSADFHVQKLLQMAFL